MDRAELALWLRLLSTPGVGNQAARKLLAAFGLPQDIFGQTATALRQVVSQTQAAALARAPAELEAQVEATWNWLHKAAESDAGMIDKYVLTLADTAYPPALLMMDDPPPLLYLQGNARPVSAGAQASAPAEARAQALTGALARCIAIVGSRNPTPQGLANARQFAHSLSAAGLTVVSGLALGVDGAAHEGALDGVASDSGRLATVAVVGTGLDRVYPKRHLELARRIAQRGLLISEYPIGTAPLAANFPRRNRIIAGLSLGTLVVEAALQSGSLITARLASEQGKEVFAIPGSIHSTQSRGCHALIRQGAKLVESALDVLEELRIGSDPIAKLISQAVGGADASPVGPLGANDGLIAALGFDPVGLDALQARTGINTAALQAQLMTLELQGQVARLPGGLFQRMAST